MKFDEFDYKRPSIEEYTTQFLIILDKFKSGKTLAAQNEAFKEIRDIRTEFDSMYNICRIRHTIDTADKFYEEENNFFDENLPAFEELVTKFYRALVTSTFKDELQEQWGKQLFTIAELSAKTITPEILDDLKKENALRTEYTKIKASARIQFQGRDFNLSSIQPFEVSESRAVRKSASETKWKFFENNATKIEGIFDRMVQVRHQLAQKLGYKNFIEVGYARMLRSDYNPEMVANFREQVLKYVVPIATALRQRQSKRIDQEEFLYYDEPFEYSSGNPKPQGSPAWIIENAKTMYNELSGETKEFFDFMIDNKLVDLETKTDKAPGGYCSFIDKYRAPFIFSNFNGTSGDIDVLTHEAGHAFQVYSSKDIGLNEYQWPTFEACEIHSMSMEFFTWPWMHLFFEGETDKYKFAHLSNSILFIPYGVAVDEFQHYVYEFPEATTDQRNKKWREIERKYLPHRNYADNEFLEQGGYWQRQRHIFGMPFYYIDYTLAQVCAFQFWIKDRENHTDAWDDYVRLCKAGGSKSFLDLVKLANLKSPFDDGCVKETVEEIKKHLDQIDDSSY